MRKILVAAWFLIASSAVHALPAPSEIAAAVSAGRLAQAEGMVREVIRDGENGLLTDFFDVAAIADRVEEALTQREAMQKVRAAARQTIVDAYDWRKLLPKQVNFLQQMAMQVRRQHSHYTKRVRSE